MELRIIYIGIWGDKCDEGLSQISKNIYSHFNKKYEVKFVNTFDCLNFNTIKVLLNFKPHIIGITSVSQNYN